MIHNNDTVELSVKRLTEIIAETNDNYADYDVMIYRNKFAVDISYNSTTYEEE